MIASFPDMLAARDFGDTIELVIFIVIIVITILGGLIQKVLQKYAQKQAEEKARLESIHKGTEPAPQLTPPPQKKSRLSAYELAMEMRKRQAQQQRLLREQQRQLRRQQNLRAAAPHGPPPVPPPQASQPEIIQLEPLPTTHVEMEVAEQRGRLRRRLAKAKPKVELREVEMASREDASWANAEKNLGTIKRARTEPAAVQPIIALNLDTRDGARTAIMYHEIFSPPKALRFEAEMWDVY